MIGVFLDTGEDHPDLQHPFFHEVLVGLKSSAGQAGYDLLLFARQHGSNVFGHQSYLDRCRQHRVDGAVVMGATDEAELRRLIRSEVPCIGVDIDVGEVGAVLVTSDNVTGGKLAVEHLHDLGHRRIATIAGLMHTRPGIDRLRGYRQALQELRLAYRDEYVTYGDYYVDSGSRAMEDLLDLDEQPTAVFVASDLMAIGAIRSATAAGLRVPEELSVVGYDDISLAEHLQPPLTTIRQDKVRLGVQGGVALVEEIEGASGQRSAVTLPIELVVRKSTAEALVT